MSLLSVPKQRSSSSHVRLEFEDWGKLLNVGNDYSNHNKIGRILYINMDPCMHRARV